VNQIRAVHVSVGWNIILIKISDKFEYSSIEPGTDIGVSNPGSILISNRYYCQQVISASVLLHLC